MNHRLGLHPARERRAAETSPPGAAAGPSRPWPAPRRGGPLVHLSLRVRLVAGFSAAMLVVLAAAGAFVYWRIQYALDRDLDRELTLATTTITPLIDPSGHVTDGATAEATGMVWQVLGEHGGVLDSSVPGAAPMVPPRDLARAREAPLTSDIGALIPVADRPYRVRVTPDGVGPPGTAAAGQHYLLAGVRRDHRDEALRELLVQLVVAGLGALVVTAIVGHLLAGAALRPVERYRRRAEEIAAGASGLRLDVPAGRDDEVTRLGHTLNDMLAALEAAMEHERRFVDDASHELRTPLTLLKSRVQLARRRRRDAAEHERILDELAVDVTRLADLAEQLLALGAAADGAAGTVEVTRLVAGVVERRRTVRPDQAHHLLLELPTSPVHASIAPLALERVVSNLLENAFAHGRPPVHVRVDVAAGWVRVRVQDAGPGMPDELLRQATGRFTRSAEARARPGAGLGLSLVEQLVSHAGGELRLCHDDTHVSHGTVAPPPCEHGDEMTAAVLLRIVEPD